MFSQPLTLDHVNIRTAQLAELRAFYVDVIGLREGLRPPSSSVGAWLYAGERPVVHLVQVAESTPQDASCPPRLSHFAFTGQAAHRAALLARLAEHGVPHQVTDRVSEAWVRVRLADPDGNELHLDFARDKPAGHTTAATQTCGQELASATEVPAQWAALMSHVALNLDAHASWVGTDSEAAALEHDGMRAVAAAYRSMADAAIQAARVMTAMAHLPAAPHDPNKRDAAEQVRWMRTKITLQRDLAQILLSHADASAKALAGWESEAPASP